MEYEIKQIEQKIYCENELRKVLNSVVFKVTDKLKSYKGKVIYKSDNTTLLKKINDEFKEILKNDYAINPFKIGDYAKIHYLYVFSDSYSLSLKIGLNANGGSYEDNTYYCFYYDKIISIGDISKGILKDVYETFDLKPINPYEQIRIFKKAMELKNELDSVKSEFKPYELRELVR